MSFSVWDGSAIDRADVKAQMFEFLLMDRADATIAYLGTAGNEHKIDTFSIAKANVMRFGITNFDADTYSNEGDVKAQISDGEIDLTKKIGLVINPNQLSDFNEDDIDEIESKLLCGALVDPKLLVANDEADLTNFSGSSLVATKFIDRFYMTFVEQMPNAKGHQLVATMNKVNMQKANHGVKSNLSMTLTV